MDYLFFDKIEVENIIYKITKQIADDVKIFLIHTSENNDFYYFLLNVTSQDTTISYHAKVINRGSILIIKIYDNMIFGDSLSHSLADGMKRYDFFIRKLKSGKDSEIEIKASVLDMNHETSSFVIDGNDIKNKISDSKEFIYINKISTYDYKYAFSAALHVIKSNYNDVIGKFEYSFLSASEIIYKKLDANQYYFIKLKQLTNYMVSMKVYVIPNEFYIGTYIENDYKFNFLPKYDFLLMLRKKNSEYFAVYKNDDKMSFETNYTFGRENV